MNAKRKTSAMLALLMALGVANVVRGDDLETIRRFPKPTPLPASTARVGTDKDVAHNALHHKFSDMVGKPDRKGSIHFNGHPAEIAALTLDKLGLMNGYPDGTFRPDRTITRAEFAAVVSRAFKFAGSPAAAAFSDPDGPLMETEAVKMVVASLFALLMAVTMWAYSKLTVSNTAASNDPSAKSMQFMSVWMMPIMMFFICNNLSSALSYYYLISQLISMAEIFIIRKFFVHPEEVLAKVKASEGKPLPKSKWQQRLEEAQKMQAQQMKNRR